MAHYQQQKFVEIISQHCPEFFKNQKILEVGSWNANQTVRRFFENCHYVGADIAEGPGVDLVCPGQDLAFPDHEFDLVISGECFEHNPAWVETFNNMHRMLKPGGLCLMTCASIGRGEHGTGRKAPDASLTVLAGHDDYYANISKGDFHRRFKLNEMFEDFELFYNIYFCDLYFIGIKKGGKGTRVLSEQLKREIRDIRELPAPTVGRTLSKAINFWTTFAWARLLGEKRYHHLKFTLSQGLKKAKKRRQGQPS